jgi:probable HAF family extracellular repeat protein
MRRIVLFVIGALAFSALLLSQQSGDEHRDKGARHRYKLVDLGTLGGPISYGFVHGDGGRLLNDEGVVSSYGDTTTPDPNAPNLCYAPDGLCLVAHAFRWRHNRLIDLGALDNNYSSAAVSINDRGSSAGESQTGLIIPVPPLFPEGFPQVHATLWKGRRILDLDTLPGGTISFGVSVNNAGQVVGFSNNGVPDPYPLFPTETQARTFIWEHGNMEDIGTLGGPDAFPGNGCDNQRPGVIVGLSYTSYTPNASTGVPTVDPFLWDNGIMTDLGNLGGTFNNFATPCINNRGEVVGNSNLPGDQTFHAYRWRNGKMKDLGTLGGPDSEAIWINDEGDIAGSADLPAPGIHNAVIWRHGHIKDLGTVPGDSCSRGRAINSRGQVVGGSSDCVNFLHAFVWEEGGPMRDLNKLIAPGSGLQLTNAFNINDRGEILAKSFPTGTTPNDDADLGHLVLLIPCDKDDHEGECSDHDHPDDDAVAAPTTAPATDRTAMMPHSQHSLTAEDHDPGWQGMMTRRLGAPNATTH